MPYVCKLEGSRWKMMKKDGSKIFGSHSTRRECNQQIRAVYSSELSNPNNILYDGMIVDYGYLTNRLESLKDESEINVVIKSKGGDFLDAMSIHNALRNSGKKIICHIAPFAISAGAIIAMSGDTIYMPENGLLMFHRPKVRTEGDIKDSDELKNMVASLDASKKVLVNTLVSRTKKSVEEIEEWMQNDKWLTADEALKMGIIDEIVPIYRDVKVENFFPEQIVNFLTEKDRMAVKDICDQFGVEGTEDALVKFINGLKGNQQAPPPQVSTSIVNMVKNARETQLNALVVDGKLLPTVVNELKTTYCIDERIKADAATDNKEFDNIVNALAKNEQILSFKGKTGVQGTANLEKPGEQEGDENLLANLNKARASA